MRRKEWKMGGKNEEYAAYSHNVACYALWNPSKDMILPWDGQLASQILHALRLIQLSLETLSLEPCLWPSSFRWNLSILLSSQRKLSMVSSRFLLYRYIHSLHGERRALLLGDIFAWTFLPSFLVRITPFPRIPRRRYPSHHLSTMRLLQRWWECRTKRSTTVLFNHFFPVLFSNEPSRFSLPPFFD